MTDGERAYNAYLIDAAMTAGEREWVAYTKTAAERTETAAERKMVVTSLFDTKDLLIQICEYAGNIEAGRFLSSYKKLKETPTLDGEPLIAVYKKRHEKELLQKLDSMMRGIRKAKNRRNNSGFVVGERVVIEYDDLNSRSNWFRPQFLKRYKPSGLVGKRGYVMGTTPQQVYIAMGDLFNEDINVQWVMKRNYMVRRLWRHVRNT